MVEEQKLYEEIKVNHNLDDMIIYFENYSNGSHLAHVQGYYKQELKKFLAKLSSSDKLKNADDILAQTDALRKSNNDSDWKAYWTEIVDIVSSAIDGAKEDYIQELIKKKGTLKAKEYYSLFKDDLLTNGDYERIGVSKDDLDYLKDVKGARILDIEDLSDPVQPLPDENTEIYFWGMPASGKTCCLGAILSEADKLGYTQTLRSGYTGNNYFDKLNAIFSHEHLSTLCQGTNEGSIAFASITFKHPKYKKRQCCLIDLAGETFKSMYYKNCKKDDELDETRELCLKATTTYLTNTSNRKLHFFLVPYTKKDVVYGDGLSMKAYLSAGVEYLKANKVIKNSTDGIYIVLTKTDAMGLDKDNLDVAAEKFVKDRYLSFYNTLQSICEENGISKVEVLPFSIGELLSSEVCRFNAAGAQRIIDIICKKSYKPGSLLDRIFGL